MKKYSLASPEAKSNVNLRDYEDIIVKVIHEVIPEANVVVLESCYIVDNLSKGDSIRIGKKLAKTDLGSNCVLIAKLFNGKEI